MHHRIRITPFEQNENTEEFKAFVIDMKNFFTRSEFSYTKICQEHASQLHFHIGTKCNKTAKQLRSHIRYHLKMPKGNKGCSIGIEKTRSEESYNAYLCKGKNEQTMPIIITWQKTLDDNLSIEDYHKMFYKNKKYSFVEMWQDIVEKSNDTSITDKELVQHTINTYVNSDHPIDDYLIKRKLKMIIAKRNHTYREFLIDNMCQQLNIYQEF